MAARSAKLGVTAAVMGHGLSCFGDGWVQHSANWDERVLSCGKALTQHSVNARLRFVLFEGHAWR
jgi:hypothetical protein